ncbi:MAG: HlyD family secretion protein [Acidobacteriota bacterium]
MTSQGTMVETSPGLQTPASETPRPGQNATTPAGMPAHEPVLSEKKSKKLYFIVGGVALALLIGYLIFTWLTAGKEKTDDAQIDADVVPVSARVSGQIDSVLVRENQFVKQGEVIARMDSRDAQVKVQQAESELLTARAQSAQADAQARVAEAGARGGLMAAEGAVGSARESVDASGNQVEHARAGVTRAEASAEKARLDFQRASDLFGKGDIARAQLDTARAARDTTRAEVEQAQAALRAAIDGKQKAQSVVQEAQGRLRQSSDVNATITVAHSAADLARAGVQKAEAGLAAARLSLSYTEITAPQDGFCASLNVRGGQAVSAGQPICQLVPRQTYIVANFKETQLRDMKPGQKVDIEADALNGKSFEGSVESLSGGTGASFSLLPPENASGNFVKVVQRVPVRISWNGPPSNAVPVGSSVNVIVHTK